MKSLKSHISLIIPLFVLLFSYQFSSTMSHIVNSYEKNLTENYAVVVLALKPLRLEDVQKEVSAVHSLSEIDSKELVAKFKDDLSKNNLKLLESMLPKFYVVKLGLFPKEHEVKAIEEGLLKVPFVTKVETFSKTHSELYRIMSLAKSLVSIFAFFVIVVSLLLVFKQIEVWTYAHKERIEIMELFGAPFWMKSAILYKLVVIDSIICVALVSMLFYMFQNSMEIVQLATDIGFSIPTYDILPDGIVLMFISLFVSLMSVSYVMLRVKKEF